MFWFTSVWWYNSLQNQLARRWRHTGVLTVMSSVCCQFIFSSSIPLYHFSFKWINSCHKFCIHIASFGVFIYVTLPKSYILVFTFWIFVFLKDLPGAESMIVSTENYEKYQCLLPEIHDKPKVSLFFCAWHLIYVESTCIICLTFFIFQSEAESYTGLNPLHLLMPLFMQTTCSYRVSVMIGMVM